MIYVKKDGLAEEEFLELLEKSKLLLLRESNKLPKNVTFAYFENLVYEKMSESAKGTRFRGLVEKMGKHAFPDIVANKYFGVEVKMTEKDHWFSTGNSILESSRVEDIKRIYIMFGKFGGKLDIRYRLYQECLPEISVTHSPRYRINMDLPSGESIFDKIGIDYDVLRKDPNSIQKIKNYYRSLLKEGEELWWIDQDGDDKAVSPIIKPFRSLNDKEKENFIVEAMILFPEMFGNSSTKFERAAAYLIAEYSAVSASLRDWFTAGGQVELQVKGKNVLVPQIAESLRSHAATIKKRIEEINPETLAYYWRVKKVDKGKLSQWLKLVNKQFNLIESKVSASDIFGAGLI